MMRLIQALEHRLEALERMFDVLRPKDNSKLLQRIEQELVDIRRDVTNLQTAMAGAQGAIRELDEQIRGQHLPDHLLAKLLDAARQLEAISQ